VKIQSLKIKTILLLSIFLIHINSFFIHFKNTCTNIYILIKSYFYDFSSGDLVLKKSAFYVMCISSVAASYNGSVVVIIASCMVIGFTTAYAISAYHR